MESIGSEEVTARKQQRCLTLRWLWKLHPQQAFSANNIDSYNVNTPRGFPRWLWKNASTTTIIFCTYYWALLCKRSARFPTLRWLWNLHPKQSFSANAIDSYIVNAARGFPPIAGCEKMHPQQQSFPASNIASYDVNTVRGFPCYAGYEKCIHNNHLRQAVLIPFM